MPDCDHAGYMLKSALTESAQNHRRRRFFVLLGPHLYVFKDEGQVKYRNVMKRNALHASRVGDRSICLRFRWVWRGRWDLNMWGKYSLECETHVDREDWVAALGGNDGVDIHSLEGYEAPRGKRLASHRGTASYDSYEEEEETAPLSEESGAVESTGSLGASVEVA